MRFKRARRQGRVRMEEDAEEYKDEISGESEMGQHAALIESNKEQGSWDTQTST